MTAVSITEELKDTSAAAAGKTVVGSVVEGSSAGAATTTGSMGSNFAAAFGPVGIIFSALAGILIGQANYKSKFAAVVDLYRDEAAAKLGKSPDKIREKDIELLAKGDPARGIAANKTIAEELDKMKHSRSRKMLISGVSILATVAVMGAVFTGGAVGTLPWLAGFALKTLAAVAIHKVLEKPIEHVIKKVFGTKSITTHERIADLSREHRNGKAIGREQVADIFISSNAELSQFVQNQYGKPYDFLNVRDKLAVADAFEQYLPLKAITESLNSGRIKVSELAFSVEGQASGVAPNSVKDSLSIIGKARGMLHGVHSNAVNEPAPPPLSVASNREVVEYDNPTPTRSFADRELQRRAGRSGGVALQ